MIQPVSCSFKHRWLRNHIVSTCIVEQSSTLRAAPIFRHTVRGTCGSHCRMMLKIMCDHRHNRAQNLVVALGVRIVLAAHGAVPVLHGAFGDTCGCNCTDMLESMSGGRNHTGLQGCLHSACLIREMLSTHSTCPVLAVSSKRACGLNRGCPHRSMGKPLHNRVRQGDLIGAAGVAEQLAALRTAPVLHPTF